MLKLIARGLSNKDIAGELVISEGTVRVHVSSILGKLHLASRTQAALYAIREWLASMGSPEKIFLRLKIKILVHFKLKATQEIMIKAQVI